MDFYTTKSGILSGSSYLEVKKQAYKVFSALKKKTRRKPYMRSAYFNKEKIFFDFFWTHTFQKVPAERTRRLRYLKPALEVIRKSRIHPRSIQNPNKQNELLHRFKARTKDGRVFYVQIKQNKRTGRKQLMSVFPEK